MHHSRPTPPTKPKELDGYVGFANLPNQVYRKAVKKGFEFTLMVVGRYRRDSRVSRDSFYRIDAGRSRWSFAYSCVDVM